MNKIIMMIWQWRNREVLRLVAQKRLSIENDVFLEFFISNPYISESQIDASTWWRLQGEINKRMVI